MASSTGPQRFIFLGVFFFIEMTIIFLFGFCFKYPFSVTITATQNTPDTLADYNWFTNFFPYNQDIIVMTMIALAFFAAYISRNGKTAVTVSLATAAITIQVYILFRGFWKACFTGDWSKVDLDFSYVINAFYCLFAVMITWIANIGRIGPFQMLLAAIVEAFLFALNEYICFDQVLGFDLGGSSSVYTFGAVYGLAISLINTPANASRQAEEKVKFNDDLSTLFALLGALFLWVFWPSLNGGRVFGHINYGLAFGNQTHRAVINTLLALTGSCVTTYVFSAFATNKGGRFTIEDIIKATVSGGVMIAGSADLCVDPFGAILVGFLAGHDATLGYRFLYEPIRAIDPFGVTLLFLIPGFVGGFISSIFVQGITDAKLGFQVRQIFPKLRTINAQGGSQIAILGISIGISLVGGLIIGILLKPCRIYSPTESTLYAQDEDLFAQDNLDSDNKVTPAAQYLVTGPLTGQQRGGLQTGSRDPRLTN